MIPRLLSALLALLPAACSLTREPSPSTPLIPIALRAEADLDELAAHWRVPLVLVAGVVYVPPMESVPRAPGPVRLALSRLAKDPPEVEGALELPSNPVPGFPEFRVRGPGYRRVQWYDGGPLLRPRSGGRVPYLPAPAH